MWIDDRLRALVAPNSSSSVNAELDHGNRAVIELLASRTEDLGFRVEIRPLPGVDLGVLREMPEALGARSCLGGLRPFPRAQGAAQPLL